MNIKHYKKTGLYLFLILCISRITYAQSDSLVITPMGPSPEWKRTNAVSTVKGQTLEKSFTQNIMNTLYGVIPGLTVMHTSGEPGSDNPTINARGFSTFGTNINRSVLIIVDGFESTMEQLVVQEIESISLLKDASALAIYGQRGANGVLLVTTKRGAVKPLEVNFSTQIGFQSALRMPKYLDSYNYALLYDEALKNDGLASRYEGTEALEAYRTGSDPYRYPNVDWYDEILKKTSALQNYNLNFSGGNEHVAYFAMINVSDNKGLFKNTDPKGDLSSNSKFTRYNVRGNIDVNINKNLSAHLTMGANIEDKKGPSSGAWDVYNKLAHLPPNAFPVLNPNGSYAGNSTFSNPVGDLLETGYSSSNSRTIQTNLLVREKLDMITPGLSISAAFSFNNYFTGNYDKTKKYPYYSFIADDAGNYEYTQYSELTSFEVNDNNSDQWRNTIYRGTVDYERIFNNRHHVEANFAFYMDETYKLNNTSLRDYQFPYRFMGNRGRLSYGYDQRYMAEFSYGYEGSDLYARGQRYGFFPAGSLGWILSNESFMKDVNWLDYMKLRTSYGLTGNATVVGDRRYVFEQYYQYTDSYYLGINNSSFTGIKEGNLANVARTWESDKKFNLGIDMTFLGSLSVMFDYFRHDRYDIPVTPSGTIPTFLGIGLGEMNLGKTINRGFELSARYDGQIGKEFNYYIQGNAWLAKNKINEMSEEVRLYDYQRRTGQVIDQPFGLVAIGLFKDEADIAASPEQTFGDVRPGDIKYKDMNNDGIIDNQDTCPIGYTGTPEFTGSLVLGIKYKGFDFETMLYGVGNRTAYLSGATYWAFMNQYSAPESALARWTEKTATTAIYPRLSTQANPNNTQYSTFWQENGSFLKVRYIEMGYTFPENWSKMVYMKNIRFFLNGTNLFTFHHMKNLKNADPEGLAGYPQMRTISLGLKLQF